MKKISHFYREPLTVIKQYSDDELNARWDDEDEFQPEAIRLIYCLIDQIEQLEVCAIAGGSARVSLHAGAKLKISGVRAGVCDLMLLWRNRGIAFIELKARSSTSVAQREFLDYLERTQHKGCVCRTLQEVKRFVLMLGLVRRS